MADLVTLDEAIRLVLDGVSPLPGEDVAIEDAAGRFLLEDGVALTDLPPFASSAMDGFAVRAADTPGRLPIAWRVAAGIPAAGALVSGTAAEISTGGVVPAGADAVVPVERVVVEGDVVEVPAAVPAGDNVRPQGRDVERGAVVAEAGRRLDPARIGALAAAGVARVRCGAAPRVAIVTTGTELRDPGSPLGPGQIYESNGRMLAALLIAEGAVVERLGMVDDDADAHRAILERALEADVVVTSGGVSVGPHDLVRGSLAGLGVEEIFWGIAMRPGKPVSYGRRGSTLVFGLPGNPVASLVGGVLLVAPALRRLQGASRPEAVPLPARLAVPVTPSAARDDLLRGVLEREGDTLAFRPLDGQESHMIVRAARADAVGRIPRGGEPLAAGSVIDVYPLSRPGA